jgi:hypothetical protein
MKLRTIRNLGLLAFACATVVSACGGSDDFDARVRVAGIDSPTPSPERVRDAAVRAIFADAAAKNEAALLARRAREGAAGATPDPATALALYVLAPATYRAPFLAGYPTDPDGVVADYGRRFAAANLEPAGAAFPVRALGDAAADGDAVAQGKLIGALAAAAGSPLENAYREQFARAARARPGDVLAALAAAPVPARLAVLSETAWCARPPEPLLRVAPAATPQAALVSEFRADLAAMCAKRPARARRATAPKASAAPRRSGAAARR